MTNKQKKKKNDLSSFLEREGRSSKRIKDELEESLYGILAKEIADAINEEVIKQIKKKIIGK